MFTERQQQIIEVSIALIAENGIQNLTTNNLAFNIGISEPALYRHFENKLDILKGIVKYFKLTIQPALSELKSEGTGIDKIISFIDKHYEILSKNEDLAKIIFAESNFNNNAQLRDTMMILMKKSQQLLHDVISHSQVNDEIDPSISATNLSRFIIGSMRFLVLQWSMSGMMFSLENEGKNLSKDLRKILNK
jgi:AcrR family transcriptional regulator